MRYHRSMRRKEFAARVWAKLVAFDKRLDLLPRGGPVRAPAE